MRNMFLMLIGVGVFIFAVGILNKTTNGEQTFLTPYLQSIHIKGLQTPSPTGLTNLKEISIGRTAAMVSVANTDATRSKGLGGITNLSMSQGMLFAFDTKNTKPIFWMKDMLIPLDFIWITNGRVSEIDVNIPAPAAGTPDDKIVRIVPNQFIDYVLEVNAGFVAKNGIKVGDTVSNL